MLRNTPDTYGNVTKTFHWVMALLMIGMLAMGLYMDSMEGGLQKLRLYGLHKSIGVCVLVLVTLRIIWHIISRRPHFVESLKWWEKRAASLLHFFLYFAMIAMPMSGWLMSSAAGRPVSFFGFITLPDLIGQDQALREQLGTFHAFCAYVLIFAIIGHLGAALKHHFIDKDVTLRRMLPFTNKKVSK